MRRTLSLSIARRLRREHVAHLRRADAEGDGAERAVRGGVRVAAADRHARLREPALGADHVHDALLAAAPVRRSGCRTRAQLRSRCCSISSASGSASGRALAVGRDDVIDRGERALGVEDREPAVAQHARTPAARSPRGSGAGPSAAGTGPTAAGARRGRRRPSRTVSALMRSSLGRWRALLRRRPRAGRSARR